ncbi:DgyrCDS2959 [Dimorphilus gyrociliatus]|uniref:DgyrCDS2959 n=1 Tax=Dimorphilus gyrociliatus TaxID=2664684 RepID=A0A7I8VEI1_9ANNE|nr:DgyrCDS2959 [Dimorphilus gyrociliatus]
MNTKHVIPKCTNEHIKLEKREEIFNKTDLIFCADYTPTVDSLEIIINKTNYPDLLLLLKYEYGKESCLTDQSFIIQIDEKGEIPDPLKLNNQEYNCRSRFVQSLAIILRLEFKSNCSKKLRMYFELKINGTEIIPLTTYTTKLTTKIVKHSTTKSTRFSTKQTLSEERTSEMASVQERTDETTPMPLNNLSTLSTLKKIYYTSNSVTDYVTMGTKEYDKSVSTSNNLPDWWPIIVGVGGFLFVFLIVFAIYIFILHRIKGQSKPDSSYEEIDIVQHSIYSEMNNVTRVSIRSVKTPVKLDRKSDSINRKSLMVIMENDTYGHTSNDIDEDRKVSLSQGS